MTDEVVQPQTHEKQDNVAGNTENVYYYSGGDNFRPIIPSEQAHTCCGCCCDVRD